MKQECDAAVAAQRLLAAPTQPDIRTLSRVADRVAPGRGARLCGATNGCCAATASSHSCRSHTLCHGKYQRTKLPLHIPGYYMFHSFAYLTGDHRKYCRIPTREKQKTTGGKVQRAMPHTTNRPQNDRRCGLVTRVLPQNSAPSDTSSADENGSLRVD